VAKGRGLVSTKAGRDDAPPGPSVWAVLSMVLVGLYFLGLATMLIEGLVNVWPAPSAGAAEPATREVALFFGGLRVQLSPEVRLILLVAFMGAMGSYIHTATSFTEHVGKGSLNWAWVWFYLLRPFIGLSLALIFYFAIRGGLLSGSTGPEQVSAFGIAAVSGIIGMFSKQAAEKLLQVFNTLFGSSPAPAPRTATLAVPATNGRAPAAAAGPGSAPNRRRDGRGGHPRDTVAIGDGVGSDGFEPPS
jgi:hypothetical protein